MPIALESLRFPISYAQLVEQIATHQGRDVISQLTGVLKIESSSLHDPGAMMDGVQFSILLDVISKFISDEEDGQALLIKFFPVTMHGYVGLAALTAANIQQAVEMVARYVYQVMPAFEVDYSRKGDVFTINFKAVADFSDNNDLLLELVIFAWISVLQYSEIPSQKFTISLCHDKSRFLDFSDHIPGSTLILGSTQNQISFPANLLKLPIITANHTTLRLMEQELENKRLKLNQLTTLSYKISVMINKKMRASSPVDLNDIATELNLSIRTLSRRLKEEGTSFKGLHNSCRLMLAESLLSETKLNISQISSALGFLNEASFSRYFKQQTGKSPLQYRTV